ncbi:hypothetical protein ACIQVL_48510 [Streptomyces sp. NPDC090499]|uniref:hypothetical protein n=1 Tax=Streptomyces sp. NPDC090499 TaxID=3365965 RepID=UPI003812738E
MSDSQRERAARGVAKLKQYGDHDEASAIEAFLARGGWVHLRDTEERAGLSHISYTVPEQLKLALQEASKEFGWPLPAVAEAGYRAVLETGWRPPSIGRRATPNRGKRTTINFDISADLRHRVQQQLPRLTEEAGYRISESSIAVSWMCEELGVDQGLGSAMTLVLPKPLADHFQAARDAGTDLEGVVVERVGQLIGGEWMLPRPSRAPKGSLEDVALAKLSVRVDHETRDALHEMAPALSERLGVRVYPGTIVRAILTDRLGEPPAV